MTRFGPSLPLGDGRDAVAPGCMSWFAWKWREDYTGGGDDRFKLVGLNDWLWSLREVFAKLAERIASGRSGLKYEVEADRCRFLGLTVDAIRSRLVIVETTPELNRADVLVEAETVADYLDQKDVEVSRATDRPITAYGVGPPRGLLATLCAGGQTARYVPILCD